MLPCVPTLLEIAVEADDEVAGAARAALAEMADKEIDAQIVERLANAQGKTRLILIVLAGQRQVAATPALLSAIDDSDAQIRSAALTALGETIKQDNLAVLIARVASPKNAEDTPVAEKALRAACVRMPDGEACAAELSRGDGETAGGDASQVPGNPRRVEQRQVARGAFRSRQEPHG